MRLRPIVIALLFAAVGVTFQLLYMHNFEREVSGGAKVDLLVAAQPIERGKTITADMLSVHSVPQAYVDNRAIRAADRDKILNLRALTKVPVQQTLVWTDLVATNDDQRDLSALVQPGNRAMPIRVQFDEALQLIRPGDFVDILAVDGEAREASVLLQRVLVLAAGLETTTERNTDKKASQRASILTVSVSLQEAQLLGLGLSVGRLMVAVRNTADPRLVESPPNVNRSEVFDTVARQAIQVRRNAPIRLDNRGTP